MDENEAAFLRVLDPTDNSTGGGTASAVAGAMAAALVAMVARLSADSAGSPPKLPYAAVFGEAEALSRGLFNGGRADSEAFAGIRAANRLPKVTAEQQAVRHESVQRATLQAAQVPLANSRACRRVLELAAQLQGHSNKNAASDLECARQLARAGLLGCVANVRINLVGIKDAAVAEALAQQALELTDGLAAFGADR